MAVKKQTEPPKDKNKVKRWVDEQNKRSKELEQRKKDVDAAMAAWQKAADKAQAHGPDVPTKAGYSKKKGAQMRKNK